ncbi:MAG: TerC family protein [Myxococcaceae bacterium]
MDPHLWLWIGFNLVVAGLLWVDLKLVHKDERPVEPREAVAWTLVWISLSLGFCAGIAYFWSGARAVEFLTAYLVEYALSVDNLFVFLMVFSYFRVPPQFQHRLLFWGVVGAFAMRASLILLGTALVHRFHWVLYIFGAFLLYTAAKMAFSKEETLDPEQSLALRLARRWLPVSAVPHGGRFVVRENNRWKVTPIFLTLFVIELTDLVFALDSIPAVLGISSDAFIIYSSNVCAILGLRSLFFVVASMMSQFHYLKIGLSAVLAFVGLKMLADIWGIRVPVGMSLGIIAGLLLISILASVLRPSSAVE